MTFKFYHYIYNKKFINKTPYLTDPKTLTTDKVAGDQDLENPVLTITSSGTTEVASYNYCYIQDWNRYYFIVKRNWLASNVMQIWLQEDYRYTAKTLIQAQTGLCRYSGLGDTNLIDNRVRFRPETTKTVYNVEYENIVTTPMQIWYVIKFMSAFPYTSASVPATSYDRAWAINIAYLNQDAYTKFLDAYLAAVETDRVLVTSCILSINRVQYIGLNTTAMSDYYDNGIRFYCPFGGESTKDVTLTWTSGGTAECYIITGPEYVQEIFSRTAFVSTGNHTAYSFNSHSRFWELNAQYVLKLPDLQPISFDPKAFGFTSSFTINFSINYEPFSENYIIRFKDASGSEAVDKPIIQHCAIQVPFLGDTALDQLAAKELNNTVGLIGGYAGGIIGALGSAVTLNLGSAVNSFASLATLQNNYDMQAQQQSLAATLNQSVTPSTGGSDDWVYGGLYIPANAQFIQFKQTPISTPWGYKGIPDGQWRSLLTLDQTGYAEIEVDEIVGNNYNYTDNELENIKAVLSEGVIFNELP